MKKQISQLSELKKSKGGFQIMKSDEYDNTNTAEPLPFDEKAILSSGLLPIKVKRQICLIRK
jgi:hypothetical protein